MTKRPVNLTIEVDDSNPDAYALQYKDGSMSSTYFYTCLELDTGGDGSREETAWNKVMARMFLEKYGEHFKYNSLLHNSAMKEIERRLDGCKIVPVWLWTTNK
jgi:hypothetical protein